MAGVGVLSLVRVPGGSSWTGADEAVHVVLYGGLGFLAARAWSAGRVGSRAVMLAVATGLVFGAFLEWAQGHVGRQPDVGDLIADGAGTILGACTRWWLDAWRTGRTVESSS